jgi:hypothetical protein
VIINKKNEGTYVQYELAGVRLSIRGGDLILDLSQSQRDYPVHLDISENASGRLVIGPSRRYVAELDIPAREYTVKKGEKDDMGFPMLARTAVPLDVNKVTLILWAMEV